MNVLALLWQAGMLAWIIDIICPLLPWSCRSRQPLVTRIWVVRISTTGWSTTLSRFVAGIHGVSLGPCRRNKRQLQYARRGGGCTGFRVCTHAMPACTWAVLSNAQLPIAGFAVCCGITDAALPRQPLMPMVMFELHLRGAGVQAQGEEGHQLQPACTASSAHSLRARQEVKHVVVGCICSFGQLSSVLVPPLEAL